MHDPSSIAERLDKEGRVWLRNAVPSHELECLKELSQQGGQPGARIDHGEGLFKALADASFNRLIKASWPTMRPVRLVTFNKDKNTNWGVPWHQDRVITVNDRTDTPGFTNWSCKGGTWHCEPPIDLLAPMLFVRVHLDAQTADNGAMDIALGSHRAGKISAEDAAAVARQYEVEQTLAQAGDVLILAMLTLHRSPPATSSDIRRALRMDYSPIPLPDSMDWAVDR